MSKTVIALSIGAALAGRSVDVVLMDDLDEVLIGDRSKPIGGLLPEPPKPQDDGFMTRQRRRALERKRQKSRHK